MNTVVHEINLIKQELNEVSQLFTMVVRIVPSFDITDPKILPYGLKPHTRSVSWIVEQVITQQAKYHSKELGIEDLDFETNDTSLYDCVVFAQSKKKYFVNIKITSAGNKQNKNDIAAVERLYKEYTADSDFRLIYAIFRFSFDNTRISFNRERVHTFSPQFLPIYVNPRNDKIQALYYANPEYRTRKAFLKLLRENSGSIPL